MNWTKLNDLQQLDEIREQSKTKTVLIFKHSTRCSISRTALARLERNWNQEEMKDVQPYYLDLLSYREISNQIAHQFAIDHESPQLLLIKDKAVIYDRSHFEIEYSAVVDNVKK